MNTNMTRLMLPLALLACWGVANAEDVRLYRADEIPEAGDVASILSGHASSPNRPKMRGISLDPGYDQQAKTQEVVQAGLEEIAAPPPEALALPVQFAFNSSEILPEAEPQLDAVAKGIKMVSGARVIVEGHTDAYGPETYNEDLSIERAAAVKQYLVAKHHINPESLVTLGVGEAAPLDESNPYAPENRRVQFRAAK